LLWCVGRTLHNIFIFQSLKYLCITMNTGAWEPEKSNFDTAKSSMEKYVSIYNNINQ
jgi:hypothetical protein